jgi:hypothetical protein
VAAGATTNSSRLVHTAAVECANFGAYGALWLLQFVLCDRLLFAAPADASGEDFDLPVNEPLDIPASARRPSVPTG